MDQKLTQSLSSTTLNCIVYLLLCSCNIHSLFHLYVRMFIPLSIYLTTNKYDKSQKKVMFPPLQEARAKV